MRCNVQIMIYEDGEQYCSMSDEFGYEGKYHDFYLILIICIIPKILTIFSAYVLACKGLQSNCNHSKNRIRKIKGQKVNSSVEGVWFKTNIKCKNCWKSSEVQTSNPEWQNKRNPTVSFQKEIENKTY